MEVKTPLPERVVILDSIYYFIHGLVHENPLISISQEFKREINERLNGLEVICEDGFSEWIVNSQSFNEIDAFSLNQSTLSQYFCSIKNYFLNLLIKKPHKKGIMKKVSEMQTIEDFKEIRKELFSTYLSEPEGMNALLSKCGCETIGEIKDQPPLRIRRYAYEAKQAIEYAKEKEIQRLHIIVGCAHELPLEYLLRNPEVLNKLHV
jgi:hypothetical protein